MEYDRAGTAENSSRYRDTVASIVLGCFFVEVHEAADNAAEIAYGIKKCRDHSTAPCRGGIVIAPCYDQWRGCKVAYDAEADEDVPGGQSRSGEVALERRHDSPSNSHGSEATDDDCIVSGELAQVFPVPPHVFHKGTLGVTKRDVGIDKRRTYSILSVYNDPRDKE